MSPDYNRGNVYVGNVVVEFTYTDYLPDEEPECYAVVLEGDLQYEANIIAKVKSMFTPIEILSIRSIGEEEGDIYER